MENLFDIYILKFEAPAINIIIGIFLWNFAIAYCSFVGAILMAAKKERKTLRSRKFWRDAYEGLSNEIVPLRKIKDEYAPQWDQESWRWRDPRTGEFIDEQDVIPHLIRERNKDSA